MDGFQIFSAPTELSQADQDLILHAQKASENSYSPYSNFMVGAALVLNDGQIILGSNQENASYPAGLCAERVALFHCASSYPNRTIETIAVVAKRKEETDFRPVSPCGICRQVLLEFELKQKSTIRVLLQSADNQWILAESAQNLLPFSFGHDNL